MYSVGKIYFYTILIWLCIGTYVFSVRSYLNESKSNYSINWANSFSWETISWINLSDSQSTNLDPNSATFKFLTNNRLSIFGSKCSYNWKEYERPLNAICSHKPWHAWECIKWYEEYNNKCEVSYRSEDGRCLIKWNVSFKSRKKIYHLPKSAYYPATTIDKRYWENYFCTISAAEKAGFVSASNNIESSSDIDDWYQFDYITDIDEPHEEDDEDEYIDEEFDWWDWDEALQYDDYDRHYH